MNSNDDCKAKATEYYNELCTTLEKMTARERMALYNKIGVEFYKNKEYVVCFEPTVYRKLHV
jgi:hypothetical protein